MSDTATKPVDDIDAGKTAKFLANLQRSMNKRDPDDPPALPILAEIPVQAFTPTPTPAPTPAPAPTLAPASTSRQAKKKPAARPREEDDHVSMSVRLDPGTGKRVVYVRVDKTLADRLQLIAFQNKITASDGPTTINDIGIEALYDWLANQAA